MERPVAAAAAMGQDEQEQSARRRQLRRWLVIAGLGLLLLVAWPVMRRFYAVATLRAAGFAVDSRFPYSRWVWHWRDGRVTWLDETGLFGSPCFVSQLEGPGRPRLTAGTIRALHALPAIEELHLVLCDVTDDQLQELASLKHVRRISLTATPITDRGLESLGTMRTLQVINITETLVTKEGVEALRRALPRCVIASDESQTVLMPGY